MKSCRECYAAFAESPAGKLVVGTFILCLVMFYTIGMYVTHSPNDGLYSALAPEVFDAGTWKITRVLPRTYILAGDYQGHRFKLKVSKRDLRKQLHVFLEAPTDLNAKISVFQNLDKILDRGPIRDRVDWVHRIVGFRGFMASSGRVYLRSADQRPVGFGGKPGLGLTVDLQMPLEAAFVKKTLTFLLVLNSNQPITRDLLPDQYAYFRDLGNS